MLLDSDLKRIFQRLLSHDVAHIDIGGTDVSVRVFDKASKLSLSTPVYLGGNYIPKSVRTSISRKAPFGTEDNVKTYLTVDESNYRVFLNYLGTFDQLSHDSFKSLLEDFTFLADEWRLYLDENDRNDLIHVRVK